MTYHQEVSNELNYKALGIPHIFLIFHLLVKTFKI